MLRMRFYQWASKVQAERAKALSAEGAIGASPDADGPEHSEVRRVIRSHEPEAPASALHSAPANESQPPAPATEQKST